MRPDSSIDSVFALFCASCAVTWAGSADSADSTSDSMALTWVPQSFEWPLSWLPHESAAGPTQVPLADIWWSAGLGAFDIVSASFCRCVCSLLRPWCMGFGTILGLLLPDIVPLPSFAATEWTYCPKDALPLKTHCH